MWPALPTGLIAYFKTLRNSCVVCWNSSMVEATSTKFSDVFTLVPYLQEYLLSTNKAAKFSSILDSFLLGDDCIRQVPKWVGDGG